MKKILIALAVILFIAGSTFTGCDSPSQKVQNAEDNVQNAKEAVLDAKSDLNLARQDSISVVQQFKSEYEIQIVANEKRTAKMKLSFADANK